MKPHARMLHHFRFIAPLLPVDEDKISPLHYYDATIQIARISERELTEEEFTTGMQAAHEMMKRYEPAIFHFKSFMISLVWICVDQIDRTRRPLNLTISLMNCSSIVFNHIPLLYIPKI